MFCLTCSLSVESCFCFAVSCFNQPVEHPALPPRRCISTSVHYIKALAGDSCQGDLPCRQRQQPRCLAQTRPSHLQHRVPRHKALLLWLLLQSCPYLPCQSAPPWQPLLLQQVCISLQQNSPGLCSCILWKFHESCARPLASAVHCLERLPQRYNRQSQSLSGNLLSMCPYLFILCTLQDAMLRSCHLLPIQGSPSSTQMLQSAHQQHLSLLSSSLRLLIRRSNSSSRNSRGRLLQSQATMLPKLQQKVSTTCRQPQLWPPLLATLSGIHAFVLLL